MTPRPLAELLRGGDRRSIGDVAGALAAVRAAPARVSELVAALRSADPVVPLRAADTLEKLAREHPAWLQPYRARLLRDAARTTDPGVRWNVVSLLPTLTWSPRARAGLAERLAGWCRDDPSVIVRASALEALVRLTAGDARLRPTADALLRDALSAASPALRARARRLARGGHIVTRTRT